MQVGIVDLETTGFLNKGGHIVEIGMVGFNTKFSGVRDILNIRCREAAMGAPDGEAWIFKNSSLTVNEVANAELLEQQRPAIQSALNSVDVVTAYNKDFDFGFLRDRGFRLPQEWPCPMIVLTDIMKLPKTGWAAKKYPGYKYPSVEEAWRFLFPEFQYKEQHRGLDDAMHEASIVSEMYKRGWIG